MSTFCVSRMKVLNGSSPGTACLAGEPRAKRCQWYSERRGSKPCSEGVSNACAGSVCREGVNRETSSAGFATGVGHSEGQPGMLQPGASHLQVVPVMQGSGGEA